MLVIQLVALVGGLLGGAGITILFLIGTIYLFDSMNDRFDF